MAVGVLGYGVHHNATVATWNVFCRYVGMGSLRLHPHAETDQKDTNFACSGVSGEHQPGCFAFEEERGGNWAGSGVPIIKEARPTL